MEFPAQQPEPAPPSPESPQLAVLQAQVASLQTLLNVLLVVLLLIGAPVTAFIMKQAGTIRRQAEALEGQYAKTMVEFEKGFKPAAGQLVNQLINFSRQYPDFTPILTRNGINPPGAAPAPSLPAPTPPGVPKK
jgi:hypothetical protein